MHSDTDIKLNILLIESNLSSRSHLKRILKQSGCLNITIINNGAELISKPKLLDFDLLILDFDIDNCFTGTEFIRQLLTLKILQDHTRIIFITDQADKVSADLPFRYVTTDIIEKPVNHAKLTQKLQYFDASSKRLKLLLKQLSKANSIQKQNILQHAQFVGLDNQEKNELNLIKATNLLKCDLPGTALDTLKTISNAAIQASAQIALFNLCGNESKFKLTLLKMQSLNILSRKQILYKIKNAINKKELFQALKIFDSLDEFSFTTEEVELKALLILENHSIEEATDYLKQKLRTTLENQHYRNSLSLTWIKCLVLDRTLNHKADQEFNELFVLRCKKAWSEISQNQSPIDMSGYQNVIKLILNICLEPENKDQHLSKLTILIKQPQDCHKQFLLTCAHALLKQVKVLHNLYNKRLSLIGMMDLSAQEISFNYCMNKVFNDQFRDPKIKAALFNRWGIDKQNQGMSFQALSEFSQAHLLMPLNSVYLLNFLNTMQSLNINKYWQFSQKNLIKHAQTLELNSQQDQRLKQLSVEAL